MAGRHRRYRKLLRSRFRAFSPGAGRRPKRGLPRSRAAQLSPERRCFWQGTSDRSGAIRPRHWRICGFPSQCSRPAQPERERNSVACRDRDGNIWVGTKEGGVNRFSPASLRFGAWRRNPADRRSLSDENIRAIYPDRPASCGSALTTADSTATTPLPAHSLISGMMHESGESG